MAMTMNGEVQLAAPREAVWTKLNDPEVLKACIPGCEELEKTDDNGFRAVAKMKVGPVSARFKGRVDAERSRPAQRLQDLGRRRGRGRRLRQGWRNGGAGRKGRRHAADLRCRGADRRQAGPARSAADQRFGQETGRRIFREFRQGGAGLVSGIARSVLPPILRTATSWLVRMRLTVETKLPSCSMTPSQTAQRLEAWQQATRPILRQCSYEAEQASRVPVKSYQAMPRGP